MSELEYFNRCLIQIKNQNSTLSNDEIMEMAHEQTDNWVYRNTGEIKGETKIGEQQ